MAGDYSRWSFDPRKHFGGVLMQQGRAALDADWNEQAAILDRRLRAMAIDLFGRRAVSRDTPDAFRIAIAERDGGRGLTIGRGRIYVDGLLVENHGGPPFALDLAERDAAGPPRGALAELLGTTVSSYAEQPHWPSPDPLPEGPGPHLVYLDVWQREVTAALDRSLLEPALSGADTAARLQTAWQVRVLPDIGTDYVGPDAVTEAALAGIPRWRDLLRPSAGRLSVQTGIGGYSSPEDRLYRIEIHDPGPPGTATFKWSHANASVAARITALSAPDTLTLLLWRPDALAGLDRGAWLEITDDRRELAGRPGALRQVAAVHASLRRMKAVHPSVRHVLLTAPLPDDLLPEGDGEAAIMRHHLRLRRWEQRGPVRDRDGRTIADLDAPGGAGAVPVPPPGAALTLEEDIEIVFDLDPPDGILRTGDHWNFAARSVTAAIEPLDRAPPRGPYHHYCPLALLTFPDGVSDLRGV